MKRLLSLLGLVLLFVPANSQTFSITVNQTIPDNNTVVSFPIAVGGLPAVIDGTFGLETVCMNITHTWDADLEIQLQAPDGTTILLVSGIGGDGDNFTGTCLQGVGTPITQGSPPFTGTWKSMGTMGNVNNGQNPNGSWLLLCRDMAGQDIGTLIDFSLTFGSSPAQPFAFTSSNLPIIKLTTINGPIVNDPKVPVNMQIIDNGPGVRNYMNQTNYAYEGTIMAELQGFTGPSYPKKNFDFETVDAQLLQLDTTILGMPVESDWILKAEYLDHSLMKNTITYEMARRMGVYAPRTRACEVVLDGNYIGYYTLTEKPKRDANRLDIDRLDPTETSGPDLTGGYIIEMNINGDPGAWNSVYPPANSATCNFPVEFKFVYPKAANIAPAQGSYIHAYVDSFENALAGPDFDDPVLGYRRYVDISSFIDFMICNEFSGNYDSYGRSTFLYKENVTDGGLLKVGPPWDYDRAMDYDGGWPADVWVWEQTHPYWPFPFWWQRWWTEEYYRHQVYCRWTDLRQDVLSDQSFTDMIDSLYTLFDEAQDRNFTVWPELGNRSYLDNIDSLRAYLDRRLYWIDTTLAAEGFSQPQFYLPLDTQVCAGTVFDASFIGPQFDYNWQPGPDSAQIVFPVDGPYNLQVTDEWGCKARKTMDVTLLQADASFAVQQFPGGSTMVQFTPTDPTGSSYHWNFGDGDTSITASPIHQYPALGNFLAVLQIVDSNGCTATDSLLFQLLVSSEEGLASLGSVAPNPFSNSIGVQLSQPVRKSGVLSLYNEIGQLMLVERLQPGQKVGTLRTAELPRGIYLLRIEADGQTAVRKLVK